MLTETELSRRLNVPRATLRTWRHRRVGPPFHRFAGRTIRYDETELDRWLAANLELDGKETLAEEPN